MGAGYSCGGTEYDAVDQSIEALIRTINCKGTETADLIRSFAFNGNHSEHKLLKAFGSGKRMFEGADGGVPAPPLDDPKSSITIPGVQRIHSIRRSTLQRPSRFKEAAKMVSNAVKEEEKPIHDAAVRLQKVYRSFRTRRKLADCAVIVEQRWWKLLEFALLKRSSVSFFEVERPESVISRWSRARTRAAKVGKGLSKDGKAQKLALQHWLEAIDPRHRYGHNLHFYYDTWLKCESRQPFFYWLDVGEGKEASHDRCSRLKLQQQCIKYLGPKEREKYQVVVQDGKFVFKESGEILDTSEPKDTKWIFVLSTSKKLYVGTKKKGTFQHSSFLAGGATSAAGRLVVENGILKAVWPHSGHYRPTEQNFQEFVSFLEMHKIDLTDVKRSPDENDEESWSNTSSAYPSRSTSDMTSVIAAVGGGHVVGEANETSELDDQNDADSFGDAMNERAQTPKPPKPKTAAPDESKQDGASDSIAKTAFDRLYALCIQQLFKDFEGDTDDDEEEDAEEGEGEEERDEENELSPHEFSIDDPFEDCIPNFSGELSLRDGSEAALTEDPSTSDKASAEKQHYKRNLFDEEEVEDFEETEVPRQLIQRRIELKKGTKSYQLGKQLSCRWTTGAGPRIGCVRDYPSELQFQALEDMDLSPRSWAHSRPLSWSPRTLASPRTLLGAGTLQSPRISPLK